MSLLNAITSVDASEYDYWTSRTASLFAFIAIVASMTIHAGHEQWDT